MNSPHVDAEVCTQLAALARLCLRDEEAVALAHDLDRIVAYVALLERVDVTRVSPFVGAVEKVPLRDDDVLGPMLAREDALRAAPAVRDGHVEVPKFKDA